MTLLIHLQTSTAAPLKFAMDKKRPPTLDWACDYVSMLGLKFIHISKVCRGGGGGGGGVQKDKQQLLDGNCVMPWWIKMVKRDITALDSFVALARLITFKQ